MTQNNQKRLYSKFISNLKIVQYLGYFVAVFFSLISVASFIRGVTPSAFLSIAIALVILLLQAGFGCLIVYIVTQGLIAIIDLLSRIEQNTRPL
jgi:hypothetical protein